MLRFLLVIAVCLLPLNGFAQTYTLDQAVRIGLEQNPAFLAAAADSEAAREAAAVAKSQKLPRVNLSEKFLWTDEPGSAMFIWLNQERLQVSQSADIYNDPPARHDFETRLQLTQPLYDPDISYGIRRAALRAEAAGAGEQAVRQQVAWRIFSAYLEVQRSRAVIDWVNSSVQEAAEIHRLASEKEAAGTGLKADTLTANVRLAESRRLQISADNALILAQRRLALEMGNGEESVDIAGPLRTDLISAPQPQQPSQRPDLQALQLEHQETVEARKQSKAAWYPRLQGGASWATHDRDYPFSDTADSWMVQLQLSWQLFDGFSRRHASARALSAERSAAARQRQAEDQARFDVGQARLDTETARQQLDVSQIGYGAAEESYQLLANRYRNGLTPLAELLTAQSRVEKSRADLVTAKVQLIKSLARQHYLLGTLVTAVLNQEGTAQ